MANWACDKHNTKKPEDLEEKCDWTLNEETAIWTTTCGRTIRDDDTSFIWMRCPFCAKKIKLI